jgi:hypothetical protein
LLALIVPVAADAACPSSPSFPAFAQFGDGAAYSLAPGGSFEPAAPGWSLDHASIAEGNESFDIVAGGHSLAIGPDGSARSPWICVSGEYPSFRIFARQLHGAAFRPLQVALEWVDPLGHDALTRVATLYGGTGWAPSPVMQLAGAVPLWMAGGTQSVRLVFAPTHGSSWAIDDVFIDPYSR